MNMIANYIPLIFSILSILGFIIVAIMAIRSSQPNGLRIQLLIIGLIAIGSVGLTVYHMQNTYVPDNTSTALTPVKNENLQAIFLESSGSGLQNVMWFEGDDGLRLSSASGPLYINPDNAQETLLHYNNNANIILGYNDSGWKGKVGIGTKEPAWALDVISAADIQSGSGYLTPELTHYNGGRVLLNASTDTALRYADIEGFYGAVNYTPRALTSDSYIVGVHGDVSITGSGNIGPQMIAGVWGSATYGGTGTSIDMLMGIRGEITVNSGSGVRAASIYAAKPELNGGETEATFGVFIEDMAGMGAKRAKYPYALYSVGANPSYLAGSLGIGTVNPTAPLDVRSESGVRIGGDSKYAALFTSGAGIDINTVGGDLYLEYDRTNSVDILNGVMRVATDGTVSVGGPLKLDAVHPLQVSKTDGTALDVIRTGSDNAVRLQSPVASLFLNPTSTTETAINYENNANILLGYSASGWQGKVGIGTNTPAVALDVHSSSGIRIGASTDKYLSLFTSGTGIDIDSTGADLFLGYDKTNAVDILQNTLHATTGGNVGIGTAVPSVALDIAKDSGIKIGSSVKHLGLFTSGIQTDIVSYGAPLNLNYDASQPVSIHNGAAYFSTNGKVGIGTETPQQALDVVGTIKSSALTTDGVVTVTGGILGSEQYLSVTRGGTGAGSLTQNGILYGNGTNGILATAVGVSGQILRAGVGNAPEWATLSTVDHGLMGGLIHDDHTQYALLSGRTGGQTLIGGSAVTDGLTLQTTSGTGTTGADMHFLVGDNGNLEAMTILNNGRVGIGTNNPSAPLHINSASGMRVGTDSKYIDLFTVGGGNDIASSHTLHLNFLNNQDVSIGEGGISDLFISGKVGIGNTNPGGALDITSTTGGLIVPRMTTEQRDALTAVNGTILYNTSTNQFNFYENGSWVTK